MDCKHPKAFINKLGNKSICSICGASVDLKAEPKAEPTKAVEVTEEPKEEPKKKGGKKHAD